MWPFSSSSSSSSASTSAQPAPAAGVDPNSPTAYFQGTPQFDHSHQQQQAQAGPSSSSASASSPSSSYTPSTSDLFSQPSFDYARLHPLAGLGKDELEYLDIVDASPTTLEGGRTALPSRGWSDDLCYGTGTTYLSGLGIGGLLGAREGLARPLGVQSPTFRLRLNAVLNQVTRRGSFMGNSAGVIALIYNIFDASIDGIRGKHDMAGSIAAGGISGALFKCTAGTRPMVISSGIMMALAATWSTVKQSLV